MKSLMEMDHDELLGEISIYRTKRQEAFLASIKKPGRPAKNDGKPKAKKEGKNTIESDDILKEFLK